jgi:DNA-binding XRE family transcriptional regulator
LSRQKVASQRLPGPPTHKQKHICYYGPIQHPKANLSGVRPDAIKSAALMREARLRAGLSQQELAARSGRERTVIARWEQGSVSPSFDTVIELVRACGFDLPLELAPYDPADDERIAELQMLSPERRLERLLDRRR